MRAISSKSLGLVFIGWLSPFWFSYLFCKPVPEPMGNRLVADYPARKVPLSSEWFQGVSTWIVERSPSVISASLVVIPLATRLPALCPSSH